MGRLWVQEDLRNLWSQVSGLALFLFFLVLVIVFVYFILSYYTVWFYYRGKKSILNISRTLGFLATPTTIFRWFSPRLVMVSHVTASRPSDTESAHVAVEQAVASRSLDLLGSRRRRILVFIHLPMTWRHDLGEMETLPFSIFLSFA